MIFKVKVEIISQSPKAKQERSRTQKNPLRRCHSHTALENKCLKLGSEAKVKLWGKMDQEFNSNILSEQPKTSWPCDWGFVPENHKFSFEKGIVFIKLPSHIDHHNFVRNAFLSLKHFHFALSWTHIHLPSSSDRRTGLKRRERGENRIFLNPVRAVYPVICPLLSPFHLRIPPKKKRKE